MNTANRDRLNILIVGAGSWGTTLSVVLAEKGHDIWLWVRNKETLNQILKEGKNSRYAPDLQLPSNVTAFHDIDNFKQTIDVVIFAVPSHALRSSVKLFYDCLDRQRNLRAVVNVAKGFELDTNLRLSEVMGQTLPVRLKSAIACLSGPNISSEIAKKLPSVSTLASPNQKLTGWLQSKFSTDYFRIYTNQDLIGVEIGAAVKNIIAISAGISDGLGYGTNTKAALVTRGLYEITRFGIKMGARALTFSGISGMGDLITTCFNSSSRNRLLGQKIAEGNKPDLVRKQMYMVAEGYNTAKVVYRLSRQMKIDVPITLCIYNILYRGADPKDSVFSLMNRKFKPEIEQF
ncbi:MAG: NAD(P)-dependent glycerol-3-phosphate dehydrogenase [Actinomycetia bacterium]|nr:NAD(P)-dependent glycerol-3-phosphate dehydrogenase [Actinomycetes bacterium]